MHFLYNIGILLLGIGVRVHGLFNPKSKEWVAGRKEWRSKLPDTEKREVIWFHCASLGEFDQGLPLMWKFRNEHPEAYLVITFFSPSGIKHYHKRNHPADHVCYLPLDTPSNARTMMSHFKPKYFCLIKYEFWSNHIIEAKKMGAKVYNVSGLFREDHRFFKSYGSFFRDTLKQFDWFFVQNDASVDLLSSIEIHNVSIVGDSRYDKVYETKISHTPDAKIAEFCGNDRVFIIGSSWPKDEDILLPVINKMECKVIIAPHNIDEKSVQGIMKSLRRPHARYTNSNLKSDAEVLVLDTIGHLSSAYSFGAVAYIGGGFSGNLHNILEPAVFGMGVIIGPNHSRFPEASLFIKCGFGFDVSTSEELKHRIEYVLENKECIDEKAESFVDENRGASQKMYDLIIGG
ncbi:3-deoxy-D-manno-octulosonic acid transferase [Crocinitomicaceae bacterium]|nr:3-deoxy-D-manno-octulosonic acid transferase [Crocinitomicaceae bacterium]MDB3906663.1 3-deoxy-D-manno-octulosonic acid transferase [Crocinitomicaceae bacterium]